MPMWYINRHMKDILKMMVLGGLFLVPLLTLYVENNYFFPYITGKNFAFRIIVETVFAGWVVLAFYDAQYRPRFSWLLASFGAFIAVMFVANLNAEHPGTSFWSNYERMDGYVTLVHVFMYMVVLGSMIRTPKFWSYFLHTSVVVAGLVALNGLSQLSSGVTRVDSTLGNAAYMAVYMLFHIFILAFLFVRSNVTTHKVIYTILALMFLYVLLQTGTRGTAIGLAVGAITTVSYIALFGTRYPQIRKYAIGSFVFLVLMIGAFIAARDTSYIQNTSSLARIANIDLGKDLAIRSIIWGMAWEGVKERPILGWGQGNFNYVFNTQYDPRLYEQEQWFDRVHDIVLDWLIAGGIVGLVSYFSIFAALLYYLFIKPFFYKDESFTVLERGVLIGLVAGYITHNLVVFDNIVSYIFFGTILALIHSQVSRPLPSLMKVSIPSPVIAQIVAPLMLVACFACIYFVNVPSMQAAGDLINALRTQNLEERLGYLDTALTRGSFARQELVEQFAQQAMTVARTTEGVSPELRAAYLTRAESELTNMLKEKPGDARLHVFAASYYRSTDDLAKAKESLAKARVLSPSKQTIIIQQGAVALSAGDTGAALGFFKEAFDLDTNNNEAREYYVGMLFNSGATSTAMSLVRGAPESFAARAAGSDYLVGAVNSAGDLSYMAELYEIRVASIASTSPNAAQTWASLAFVYYQLGDNERAINTLMRAKAMLPPFAKTADCIAGNLKAGLEPQLNCE